MDKREVRAEMKRRRACLTEEERAAASRSVCAKLREAAGDVRVVAVYLAKGDELDVTVFIRELLARGSRVVAPAWNGKDYSLAPLVSLDAADLVEGPFGVKEPRSRVFVPPSEVTLWLIPGLAFTHTGARLGYGGGWYDRLLAEAHPTARRLACAYPFQILPTLPTEPHDQRIDDIISP